MVETTDTRPGYYLASAGAELSTFRRLLPETTVGAVLVVVVDIRGEQPFQMRFVEGNHLIQQFTLATADPPLRMDLLRSTPLADEREEGCLHTEILTDLNDHASMIHP